MQPFRSLSVFLGFLLTSTLLFSQSDLSGPAPMDPEIRTGRLENGLTYFIRKNGEPEKRASFYIIQNVGAILEKDEQNGLAHFLEHMSFNGTAHFPGNGIISGLEKHGVAFGRNINAYTGFDETVYNLTNVPVEIPGIIDTCLLILNDWSDYITLEEEEIDLERGVIAEEWRTSKTASRRMIFEVIPVVLKGSKYAERDIIGDLDVINNFKYETLRDFYHEWYRTDLQAIAVVGDIDVDEVEKKIVDLFSSIKPVDDPTPREPVTVPWHEETYFVLAPDKEAPQTTVSVLTLHEAVRAEEKNLAYVRDNYLISLMNLMINTRVSELLQKEDPPFISGSISYGSYYARGYDAFSIDATARKNEEAEALKAIYTEAERAHRFGFNHSELERAKADMLSAYENYFKQKDKIDNDTYIAAIQNYYLTGEPLTSIDFDFEFLKEVIDGITAEEISSRFREMMTDKNRTVVIQGLEGDDVIHLSKDEALDIISGIKNTELTPYEDEVLGESLIEDDLPGSEIINRVELTQFDAVEWTLGNNAKVVYRKADYEKDNIILSAFSFGGISLIDDDLVVSASLLPSVFQMYGAGDYDNITLQKILSGKQATVSVSLGETTESVSGSSTPKDFETMMQLMYLRLAKPRFDRVAHQAIIDRYTAYLGNMENDPDKIMSDSISLITTGYNPRTPLLTKESVSAITLDDIQDIYTNRFKGADEFTFFIVGNIEEEEVIPSVKRYIGSLPSAGREETWSDRKVRQPEGRITKDISIPLTIPKATVYLSFSEEMKYNPYNYLGLEVLEGILDIVYTEKVREEEGGTYGVGVSLSAGKRPVETGKAAISFDCDPERAEELKDIIYSEIDRIMKEGPGQENLDKAVKNILKTREENKMHNAYWAGILTGFYSNGIDNNDPANYEDILGTYTIRDIRKISRKMFRKADVTDITFHP